MDKNLKETIQKLYETYDYEHCLEYFSNGNFLEDCKKYFDYQNVDDILDFITETIYDINTIYRYKNCGSEKLKEMLENCLKKFDY